MQWTQTQLVNAALASPDTAPMSLEQIVTQEIREFKASPHYHELLVAGRYYCNRSDIQQKHNDIAQRSNTKMEHPIYRRLVDQKTRYLLSRPWSIQTKHAAYGKALEYLLDQSFRRQTRRMGKNAIRDGTAWLQPYVNQDGVLAFMMIPATELIPLWHDSEESRLDGFIRIYDQIVFVGRQKRVISKAEYWYNGGVKRFADRQDGTYRQEVDEVEPHFQLGETGYNWNSPPLVWLRYNDEELPLLRYVKELIDDYNWQTSITADVLRDVAKFVYVLKNYGGVDLGQFVSELQTHLAIQVEGDGGVDKLQSEINVDSVLAFLEKQRRDLYEFAAAVDTKDPDLGAASGKAIGFRYMDLDADCADLAAAFQETFLRLKPFLDTWLQASGQGDFFSQTFEVIFNMDMPVDETEIIANIQNSASLLSRRTLLSMHPWVKDVDKELDEVKQERQEDMESFGAGLFADQAQAMGGGISGNNER